MDSRLRTAGMTEGGTAAGGERWPVANDQDGTGFLALRRSRVRDFSGLVVGPAGAGGSRSGGRRCPVLIF